MARFQHLALAALVLSSAFVAPGLAARQLQQQEEAGGTIIFPGCTFLQDSEIARNQDYSTLYTALQATGVYTSLNNLSSPATLFAPTNEAFAEFLEASNHTAAEALSSPLAADLLLYHVTPGAYMALGGFVDGSVLPTALANANVTIATETVNRTETVMVDSYGAETTIVTPAAYACNLVIYGINGVLVPEEGFSGSNQDDIMQYLETTLEPGSAEVPVGLVVALVQAGDLDTVVSVFDNAITAGYTQQLVALAREAVNTPNGVQTLAAVTNELIQMTSCDRVQPVIREAAPQLAGVPTSTLNSLGQQYPDLRSCVVSTL